MHKKKSIPNVNPLVEAMFTAELGSQLLTAGHDMDKVEMPIKVELVNNREMYRLLNGEKKETVPSDMMMVDDNGVLSTIIYGPNHLTRITKNTKNVIFVVYAPPGVKMENLEEHLNEIELNVNTVSPEAIVELHRIYKI